MAKKFADIAGEALAMANILGLASVEEGELGMSVGAAVDTLVTSLGEEPEQEVRGELIKLQAVFVRQVSALLITGTDE